MSFFKHCAACGKRKLYTTKRSYIMPKVSSKPITSKNELCGTCFRQLKKLVK